MHTPTPESRSASVNPWFGVTEYSTRPSRGPFISTQSPEDTSAAALDSR